jgi:hypothetical protein
MAGNAVLVPQGPLPKFVEELSLLSVHGATVSPLTHPLSLRVDRFD